MARRYKLPYKGRKYLADKNSKVIHDLDKESRKCQIDTIKVEDLEMLDSIFDVRYLIKNQGYSTCSCCLGKIVMIQSS
jgi:hypothetical protein